MPTILITGAGRGLGFEFAKQYAAEGWTVIATVRKPEAGRALAELGRNVEINLLDVTDRPGIAKLARALEGRAIDVLLCNSGMIGSREALVAEADYAVWHQTMEVNLMAPVAMAQAFLPHVAASEKKLMVFVTSRMGSIAQTSGGSMIYRTSKAALNMAAKNLSIAFADKQVAVIVVHPGWVKTDMGGPGAAITPQESISGLRKVIAKATFADSGHFYNYDGIEFPW